MGVWGKLWCGLHGGGGFPFELHDLLQKVSGSLSTNSPEQRVTARRWFVSRDRRAGHSPADAVAGLTALTSPALPTP